MLGVVRWRVVRSLEYVPAIVTCESWIGGMRLGVYRCRHRCGGGGVTHGGEV